jgi:hypothetical protein
LHAPRIRLDRSEESLAVGRREIAIAERFGEATNHGERRLELVRHVGDEIAANGLEPPPRREVHEREHGAAVG